MDVPQNRWSGSSCHANGSCNLPCCSCSCSCQCSFSFYASFGIYKQMRADPRPLYRSPHISLRSLSLSLSLLSSRTENPFGNYVAFEWQRQISITCVPELKPYAAQNSQHPAAIPTGRERESERRQLRLSSPWTRNDCIPSRIRRFNPFFVMSSALKHTICLSPGTDGMREIERERESPLCSVPHLELKKTLRKTQSSSELPSFACVLWIFQHFQEYLQCLPYNKHSVKCFSFSLPLPLSLSPLSPCFFLLLGWSFLQFDWNRELV